MPACSSPPCGGTYLGCREEFATEVRCSNDCQQSALKRFDDEPEELFSARYSAGLFGRFTASVRAAGVDSEFPERKKRGRR